MSTSIHADAANTLRVSARRFEPSPFREFYTNEHTVHGVYAGRYYSVFNGEDTAETYWTLRRKAALYDVPERPVEISGPDAVPFMERIFARPIGTLKEGRGRYAIACTPQGGVFMDGILFKLSEDRFWYVQPDGALEAWLVAHSDGFDVTISDPRARVIQIQGPASMKIMSAASGGAIDESMKYFHAGFFDLGGQRAYVSRTGWTGELGYEVYAEWDTLDPKRLWNHLFASGEPHGMVFSSIASMEVRRIEAGILDNLTDFDRSMTPFEAGLEPFIDMDKPDFVGREALLKVGRGTLLYGVKCAAVGPDMNCTLLDAGEVVASITAGAWSPFMECGIGYARFKAARAWAGQALTLRTGDGAEHPCEIVALPFYDAEKRIPRGLATEAV